MSLVSPNSVSDPHPTLDFTATQDWFSHNIEHWTALLPLVTAEHPRILEIGSWEGRSAVFLANSLCKGDGSEVVCIDHFDLFRTDAGKERYARIHRNLGSTGKRFRVLPEFSFPGLMKLLEEEISTREPGYDWIYVDGSHEADDTSLDGELAWRLAKKGAVFIFDDYHWDVEPEESSHHPKRGIDAFLQLHRGEYRRLSEPDNYQVVLQKTSEMRIGFLVPSAVVDPLTVSTGFGYGINVAIVTDSSFAMAASVAIHSLLEHTPGRVSIYVVDCGMSESEQGMLRQSIPEHRVDTTLQFIPLPESSVGKEMGPVWAKADLHTVLPVERALYLDADVLVRGGLHELWGTDLGGKAIGAAVDVGLPMGHEGIPRRRYFNAGVMLLDLTKIRAKGDELVETCKRMRGSKFRDQDALNVHFADNWTEVSLEWNAQGLGTYAQSYAPNRHLIDQSKMTNPKIVHFTGPTHPSLPEVLNPYVQPYTAKPWGYAGSPGHPYAQEWWKTARKTPWERYLSTDWKIVCDGEKNKAVARATQEFYAKVDEGQALTGKGDGL